MLPAPNSPNSPNKALLSAGVTARTGMLISVFLVELGRR